MSGGDMLLPPLRTLPPENAERVADGYFDVPEAKLLDPEHLWLMTGDLFSCILHVQTKCKDGRYTLDLEAGELTLERAGGKVRPRWAAGVEYPLHWLLVAYGLWMAEQDD
jgi:hypothetical protein